LVDRGPDLVVDTHHTIEDTGILLGATFAEAWGDRAGVRRFASVRVPLDEAVADVGRSIEKTGTAIDSISSTGQTLSSNVASLSATMDRLAQRIDSLDQRIAAAEDFTIRRRLTASNFRKPLSV